MQNDRRIAGHTSRVRRYLRAIGYILIATVMGASFLRTATASANDAQRSVEDIAALANGALMVTVAEGPFIMGTARTSHEPFSFDLQYDDTEQPQRRVWLSQYEIDRDEVSLGEYLSWLRQQQRPLPEEVRKLIDHLTTIHAMSPETLARWPALYVTWSEASDFCRTHEKRLPTEAEWEKAARGDSGNLFPWGQRPPTPALAMFGQYHVHEIPIVAPVDKGKEGQSPYGLHHMAGNAAEWVEDWFGIDYYATMPDRNPHGPANGRYKVVRGGSWKSAPALLRTATRSGASPDRRAATIGFRCARSAR
ncbi:MAG TPA: SUMF1/EgtB/PvdO family nonheme iron enzyme [Nitrospiraceae bacterium]|nr:SUMF1/EgtB/PvdO family nonheme iron enzyme [Nitrospiraceae bacterium]